MSRTDKTDPYWVKIKQFYREVHDHCERECNISWNFDSPGYYKGCYFDAQWYNPLFRCGCGMCAWPSQSKSLRAADRRAIKEGLSDYYEE